jgi:dihydroorotate dehydrogenase (fumarate)
MAEAAKNLTYKPVLAKISPNWTDATATARELLELGVDGITAIDSLGPVLSIDIDTARPQVAGKRGFGWLSGAGIKPIALRYVAEIAASSEKPIIGLGGVMKADDAIEMLMAGAHAVGICTAPILRGVDYIGTLNRGITEKLEKLGYGSIAEVSRAALPNLYEEEVFRRFDFFYNKDLCIACNRCVEVCPYQARSLDLETKEMHLDPYRCRYCGLCTSVCPTGALTRSNV